VRFSVGNDVSLAIAKGGLGLVLDAVIEGLDDVFLEVTPGEWVEAARIAAARSRLGAGLAPKQVAAECGFANPDSFRRAFQRVLGGSLHSTADCMESHQTLRIQLPECASNKMKLFS
jgi:hypothetical protein